MKYFRTRVFMLTICGLLCGDSQAASNEAIPKGEIRILAKELQPDRRTFSTPVGHAVDVNPPAFFWPSPRDYFLKPLLTYDFQLSRSADFKTLEVSQEGSNGSFAQLKQPLAEGTWCWRYRRQGQAWKGPYSFSVDSTARIDRRPPSEVFVKAITNERPRIVVPRDRLEAFRAQCKTNGVTAALCKTATAYFDVELPQCDILMKYSGREKESLWLTDKSGQFRKNNKQVFISTKFPENYIMSQITSATWESGVVDLCRAYWLTGDEKYGREALRWAMRLATFPVLPGNNTTYDGNPFPDGFCCGSYLNALAYAYDGLQSLMTDEQRTLLRTNLAERLRIYYAYYCNRLESRAVEHHGWQMSMPRFLNAAITMRGDLPEADRYLSYFYDVWAARDPELGRTDGGWFGGNYIGANVHTMVEVPALFRQYTGYNYYEHPFYRNLPYWFLYRQPPGSVEDGFAGDGYGGNSRALAWNTAALLGVLDADLDLPVAGWQADQTSPLAGGKRPDFAWTRRMMGLPLENARRAQPPKDLPQAHVFPDVGVANMHRDLLNPKNDLHVALRSSPYGTFGHNLASHNAFNVVYQGDYLFVPYGHRHGDGPNSAACYRHTRGHNSVLVDGKGQPFSPQAYGWIPRFLHGEQISYACGDASHAYDAEPHYREDEIFGRANLQISDHISRGDMQRFRRHVLFLRPSLIVVYDELEAKKPVQWDWVLHCRKMLKADGARLTVDGVKASVDVLSSTLMAATVKTEPMFPAINFMGMYDFENQGKPFPNVGSHVYVSTTEKTPQLRVLALMQVGEQYPIIQKDGVVECGPWTLRAEMNPAQPANLTVSTRDGSAAFVLKTQDRGESVLSETIGGQQKVVKTVDRIPDVAKDVEWDSNDENKK